MDEFDALNRVSKGVAFLDSQFPEWRGRINVKELNMRSGIDCVLGQLASDGECYWDVLEDFDIDMGDARRMGFQAAGDLDYSIENDEWDALTVAWKAELGGTE